MALVDVTMPKMGESITEGTVIAWHKQPGDAVELDETLLEIGTDKVDTEVPSPTAGTLVEILVGEGETVEVGAKIAVLAVGAGADTSASPAASPAPSTSPELAAPPKTPPDAPESASFQPDDAVVTAPVETPRRGVSTAESSSDHAPAGPIGRTDAQGRFVSPLVRAIAEKEGLSLAELSALKGSGREGRVSKADVLRYVEQRAERPAVRPQAPPATPMPGVRTSAPAAPTGTPDVVGGERVEIIEMDRMRRIIAEHMVRSKATSPHVTSFAEIDVTNLVRHREANKATFEREHGVKLTYTPYFVHAAVEALRTHPLLNASVDGTRILVKKDIHVGIAVALGTTGLVAPVIRGAGEKNLIGLAKAAGDLAVRARSKTLQPDELQGGTFTVTNIGSLGSIMGTPIINQPQVAILATGAIKKRPAVIEDPVLGDVIAIRSMMYVSLSYDHRIIDGAMAASFLQRYVQVLEGIDSAAGV
jgi:pyruvate dehydrogenase E2 component (dihydrolipoamide acetyltransferase)